MVHETHSTFITDESGVTVALENANNMRISYSLREGGPNYVLNWNIEMPTKFNVKMSGMEK